MHRIKVSAPLGRILVHLKHEKDPRVHLIGLCGVDQQLLYYNGEGKQWEMGCYIKTQPSRPDWEHK